MSSLRLVPVGFVRFSGYRKRIRTVRLLFLSILLAQTMATAAPPSGTHGLPFVRSYAPDDIGYGARSAHLGFDRFGRIAVIHDGVYVVLNDTTWINLAANDSQSGIRMSNVAAGPDGRMYYGAMASWGAAESLDDGLFHPTPMVPANPPAWVRSASFSEFVATADGLFFVSPNGVAFWDTARHRTHLYEYRRIRSAFRVGNRVYLSAFDHPLAYIDLDLDTIVPLPDMDLDRSPVECAIPIDDRRSILSLMDGRMLVFDGRSLTPWPSRESSGPGPRAAALQQLPGGNIAVAKIGVGLLIYSKTGDLLLKLDAPAYKHITGLACREAGVLWAVTDEAIVKILYDSSLTTFGQSQGLILSWPIVERWKGDYYITSGGRLYRSIPGTQNGQVRFELYPYQPNDGAQAIAACGEHMLLGGSDTVYALEATGRLVPVAAISDLAHLVMLDENRCYVIGRNFSTLFVWQNGKWTEPLPHTRGVKYPTVVRRVGDSVWIEMVGEVARLWCNREGLQFDVVPNSTWTTTPWVNVGAIGSTVVLSAGPGERRFFDEARGTWTEALRWRTLLASSPLWIQRVRDDASGTIWATHNDGLIRFTPNGHGGYDLDASTFDFIDSRFPNLQTTSDGDLWVSASQSLYHVETQTTAPTLAAAKPVLVSLVDARTSAELLTTSAVLARPLHLPFTQNNLVFHFYAGTDHSRRPPAYEYRLAVNEPWTALGGSQLTLRGLHEGTYELQVRLRDRHRSAADLTGFSFEILPPWFRTWPAYILFATAAVTLLLGVIQWAIHRQRRRNLLLERIVHERTRQLEETMSRLQKETQQTATLAERERLANEIHDSVQQGLTGAILQLDTTLKLPAVSEQMRSRLDVVRNMVSYARQEVQHAVWDMESPLLEGTELGDALRNLTTFADTGGTQVEVTVSGPALRLDRATSHHLLRIAQEATTNAFRHANARRIAIHLAYRADAVALEIADDGQGFSPDEVLREKVGHLGLRGIRARVKKLRGQLAIDSQPQKGTAIRVTVPVPVANDSHDHHENN